MVICVSLDSISVEFSLTAGAEYLQSACLADGVGPDENPVLPGRQTAEHSRLQGLARTETQVRFHAGHAIGRQRTPLCQRDAYLVVPVHGVGPGGAEPQ